MPVLITRLRRWFAVAAILLAAVLAVFYVYAQIRARQEVRQVPQVLGLQIQQSTNGFTLSKSESGRTLFTVRAAREVEFKTGGRAELNDVTIIVYGRQGNRFDQISGKKFDYDPRSGDVVADGEVHIDLQSNEQGPVAPDQATPAVMDNPIHVDTSALTFNQKTGNAVTAQPANFRMAQASGSAVGVSYESKTNTLTLQSQVDITTSGPTPSHILAAHAVVTKEPRQVVMQVAQISRPDQTLTANRAILFLRPNNSVERVQATGDVHGQVRGTDTTDVRSAQADFLLGQHNDFQNGVLTGSVTMRVSGKQPMDGASDRAYLWFGEKNQLTKLRAVDHVKLVQSQPSAPGAAAAPGQGGQLQQVELDSDALDVRVKNGNLLHQADTEGAAQIVLLSPPTAPKPGQKQPPQPVHTTVTARKFHADFDESGRMQKVHGAPDARIVSTNPGQPDRVSTSEIVDAYFDTDKGGIAKAVQSGRVHYIEGSRQGWADHAVYTPANANLLLTGSPRVVENGGTTTAERIVMNREQGTASAEGNVKSTYSDLKPQADGAMLAASDPVHVTSTNMTADRDSGVAVYTGNARLWQDANIVEAPQITFNRSQRTVLAVGDVAQPVKTVFVQTNTAGQVTPVNVTALRLDYSDPQRQAIFSHNVMAKSADGTLTSDDATVYLLPRKPAPPPTRPAAARSGPAPSQLDRIVARGHVVIQQPTRIGHGEKLVYTAAEGKFVLSGGTPSIFDAEHGTTRGDSLTFYNRDDRVVVQGKSSSPTFTQTRVDK